MFYKLTHGHQKDKGLAFWTLAMWQNNQAIKAFAPASPHREVMQKLPHWCDEAAFADWQQDTADWPSWEVATEKLRATGRLVAVLHPSEKQKGGRQDRDILAVADVLFPSAAKIKVFVPKRLPASSARSS